MKKMHFLAVLLFISFFYLIIPVLDFETFKVFTSEDGPVESAGAIAFFFCSVIFFTLFVRDKTPNDFYFFRTRKNIFFLFFGCLFLFGAGEEISWGQRIFGFDIPESIQAKNLQNELNLHNMPIFHGLNENNERKGFLSLLLNMDRLFSMFWFSYCFIFPIFSRLNEKVRFFFEKINLPLTKIAVGVLFICNYSLSKIMQYSLENSYNNGIVELKEANFAILFFLISIIFYVERQQYVSARAARGKVEAHLQYE
jgi:hypothetical protein